MEEKITAWVARDKDDTLEIYTDYPQRNMKDELLIRPILFDLKNKEAFLMNINWENK